MKQFLDVIDRYTAIMNLSGRGIIVGDPSCKYSGEFLRLPYVLSEIIADFGLVSLMCNKCKGTIRYKNEKNIAWVEKFNRSENSDLIICNKCDNEIFNLQNAYKKFKENGINTP